MLQLHQQAFLQVAGTDSGGFELLQTDQLLGRLTAWDIEPLASSWGVHAIGVLDCKAAAGTASEPVLRLLLGETMRELQSHGVNVIEVQVDATNPELLAACQRLDFEQIDEGARFCRAR